MIKMILNGTSAWVAPKHVESLREQGWQEVMPPRLESNELRVTLKAIKRSKK